MSQRLPGIDLAIDDNAIAGSFDLGVFEAQRGIIELSLRLICRSFGHLDQRLQRKPGKVNSVNFSLGDERVIVLTKGSRAIFVANCLLQWGLGSLDFCPATATRTLAPTPSAPSQSASSDAPRRWSRHGLSSRPSALQACR